MGYQETKDRFYYLGGTDSNMSFTLGQPRTPFPPVKRREAQSDDHFEISDITDMFPYVTHLKGLDQAEEGRVSLLFPLKVQLPDGRRALYGVTHTQGTDEPITNGLALCRQPLTISMRNIFSSQGATIIGINDPDDETPESWRLILPGTTADAPLAMTYIKMARLIEQRADRGEPPACVTTSVRNGEFTVWLAEPFGMVVPNTAVPARAMHVSMTA